jgi:pimeloyl-ACP methyl ester carboxylesterase
MTAGAGGERVGGVSRSAEPGRRPPDALCRDPPVDAVRPAQTLPRAIPSGGVNLNSILYTAAGPGPHPTVLLLHGLPGNEQNVDLAQAMRRAGWNVLTIHYRGSWGGPGAFSFAHCLEDAGAALDWMQDAAGDPASRIDPRFIVVVGHSMGGFVAAHVMAERSDVRAAVMISGVDLVRYFGGGIGEQAAAEVDENVGFGAGLHILSGTSAEALADEARSNADRWRLTNYAARLADRTLLMLTSNDGFAGGSDALAEAVAAAGGSHLSRRHFATDHSYSDSRIALQTTILRRLWSIREEGNSDQPDPGLSCSSS